MKYKFTAHNIKLSNGELTRPEDNELLAESPWTVSAKDLLRTIFQNNIKGKRIVDLGCLEGGHTVEFARMGFDSLGIEVRETNIQCCNYVKENLALPNLSFVQDNVWNVDKYAPFDVIFCCGLLYHLDRPYEFIKLLAKTEAKVIIFNTHYAYEMLPYGGDKFNLSAIALHDMLPGRWFYEHNFPDIETLEAMRWASWENKKSFWLTKAALLHAIRSVGFDLVFEQFDWLGKGILSSMADGYYQTDQRGMFVGIRK